MQAMDVAPGHIFFNEGDPSDCAYLIVSGEVEIFKRVPNGTVLLASLGPNEFFGEMGLIDSQPRSASAAAKGPVVVKRVTLAEVTQILNHMPPEFVLLLRALMERLREASQKLSSIVDYHSKFSLGQANGTKEIRRITIKPLSEILKGQIPENGIVITSLPYRVGSLPDGQEPNPLDWNNLFVKGADPAVMARNHFCLQKGDQGLLVVDRGTKTGTMVNGKKIGGGGPDTTALLRPGQNTVIAGGEYSLYQFSVIWE